MAEKILEEILLEIDNVRQVGYENDDPTIEYVFEFDIQSKGLRKKAERLWVKEEEHQSFRSKTSEHPRNRDDKGGAESTAQH